ncbi:MAG: electron transfer flavoprotein subunit alpha/FixB family protein [Lachnospiraceae bacterium]|nr:electron transfer flavoprotein subunit alpha/FixB family protein [Lachnospiraceae bacterium]
MEMTGRDIWVYMEADGNGGILPVGLELLTPAQEMARATGGRVMAVTAGRDREQTAAACAEAFHHGAAGVYALTGEALEPYSAECFSDAMAALAQQSLLPAAILIGKTTDGMDLAPRLAARMRAGMAADCAGVRVQDGRFVFTRRSFSGTVSCDAVLAESGPQIATFPSGIFSRPMRIDTGKGIAHAEEIPYRPAVLPARPALMEVLRSAAGAGLDIESAEVIVAGGNGAGPEGFKLIRELAGLLHGAVGASRVAVDKGWAPHAALVGQSGKTVLPRLYINCGISGSVQHITGMRDAGCVVSINTDPKALIFNVSDYGIVGDLFKVLPVMISEIRRLRG